MKGKLRVLHLEDDQIHANLARVMLAENGIECEVALVASEADFVAAIDTGLIDLILADFILPRFNGMMALTMVRERFPDLPFIFLTGAMGEEVAIEAMKHGATDYVLKNRLSRLAPAVRRALRESRERSERKKAEEELRHSNEMFRALIEAAPLAIFLLNEDGTVKLWNPAAERIFGWSEQEVQGRPLPTVPDDKREEFALTCNWILQGQLAIRKELQRQRKDGVLIDISLHAVPVFDAQGTASSILAIATDISERKKLDRELAQSERKFRTAFEDAAVGMCLTGIDHRFLVVNRSLCNMLGYNTEELTAMNWIEATHPDDREKCQRWSDGIFAGEDHGASIEKRYLHKNGRVVWCIETKVLFLDASNAPLHFINHVQDITELKSLENQLRISQNMEALGTLTGGIAHDFNNILTAIIGYGNLLEMKLDKNDPLHPIAEHILTAADRAASLTQSLLAFGIKQNIEPHGKC